MFRRLFCSLECQSYAMAKGHVVFIMLLFIEETVERGNIASVLCIFYHSC